MSQEDFFLKKKNMNNEHNMNINKCRMILIYIINVFCGFFIDP